jgi:hypothetical protein
MLASISKQPARHAYMKQHLSVVLHATVDALPAAQDNTVLLLHRCGCSAEHLMH